MTWQKILIALLTISPIGTGAFAQEPFSKCSIPTTSRMAPPSPVVAHSRDASFIARMESRATQPASGVEIRILKLDLQGRYVPVRTILEPDTPTTLLVSNAGRLASIGNYWAFDRVDTVRMYDLEGRLAFTIEGKQVFTADLLRDSVTIYERDPSCTPVNPWICWTSTPHVDEEEQLVIADTLGGWVRIKMSNGKIDRQPDADSCRMFD